MLSHSILPPFFIVNLKRSKERRAHMKKLMSPLKTQHGVRYEFIEAVEGQQLSPAEIERRYDDAKARSTLGRSLTAGEVGCVLSHLKVYQKIVDQNLPQAFVLEDDVEISPRFLPLLEKLLATAIPYEIVLFAYGDSRVNPHYPYLTAFRRKIPLTRSHSLIRFAAPQVGTLAYLITKPAAEKFLSRFAAAERFSLPLDAYTGNPELFNLYGVSPVVMHEKHTLGVHSTLQNRTVLFHQAYKKKHPLKAAVVELSRTVGLFPVLYWLYLFPRRIKIPPTPSALPPFFIVNLKRSKKRRAHMQRLMRQLGVSFRFVEAVDGRTLSKRQIQAVYDDDRARSLLSRSLTPGEMGCVLSHLKIYQAIEKEKINHAFVLEDDVELHPAFLPFLKKLLQRRLSYHLVAFAHGASRERKINPSFISLRQRFQLLKTHALIRFSFFQAASVYGTLGYLISFAGAHRIRTRLTGGNRFAMPMDHYTGDPHLVNLRGVMPPLIQEHALGADTTIILEDSPYGKNIPAKELWRFNSPSVNPSFLMRLGKKIKARLGEKLFCYLRQCYLYLKSFYFRLRNPITPKD